ncbi:MAG: pyridoxamine 5'-phosphate oxidase family protein [Gallionella sp.]|nr:pyridoxamine 5'-phosphate oxidase family protein [Gallionella sp.]
MTDTHPSHAQEARQLLRAHRYGVLSTLSKRFDGHPFGSVVPCLTDHDGSLLIFISALAEHTKNILNDPRASLITHDQNDPHIQTQGRLTVVGTAAPVAEREPCATRWLRYFPETEQLFALGDFSFFRITPKAVRHVAGFGQARWIMSHFTLPTCPLVSQENDFLSKVNSSHTDKLHSCLSKVGTSAVQIHMIGADGDGFDVRGDDSVVRFNFSAPVKDADQALAALLELADSKV